MIKKYFDFVVMLISNVKTINKTIFISTPENINSSVDYLIYLFIFYVDWKCANFDFNICMYVHTTLYLYRSVDPMRLRNKTMMCNEVFYTIINDHLDDLSLILIL